MKLPARILWLLWFATLALFLTDCLIPLSSLLTRAAGLLLLLLLWSGLAALTWRHPPARLTWFLLTALAAGFLLLPARPHHDLDLLRHNYATGLQRYRGVPYSWGGESPTGIDCSGLIRRGLVDSLFLTGLRTLDGALVRQSLFLWSHDTTAGALGEAHEFTTPLTTTPSLNTLDSSRLLPGDLAVTRSGLHILAYLGDNAWIEADPEVGRVITVPVPSQDNAWFRDPMTVVRWKILAP